MLIPLIVLSLGGGFPSDFMFFLIVFNIFQNVNSKHTLLLLSEHMKQEREEEERERKGLAHFMWKCLLKGH